PVRPAPRRSFRGASAGTTGDLEQVLRVPHTLLEHPPIGGRLAPLDPPALRPRRLEPPLGALHLDVPRLLRLVDERDRAILLHLEEARPGCVLLDLPALEVDACRARLQGRDQRGVTREDADLAGRARDDQHHGLALVRGALRRHERDVERRVPVGHYDAAAGSASSASASVSASASASTDSAAVAGSSRWPLPFAT